MTLAKNHVLLVERQGRTVFCGNCGTGNLTRDYNDWGCLISSTAERPDVQVMKDQGWGGHQVFQYDFLNDAGESPFFAPEDGDNRVPPRVEKMLREAAKAGKRLVFLMNPPYGTAGNAGANGTSKEGITSTAVNGLMKTAKLGACSQQLYAQFMYQCSKMADAYGFKQSTVATFSVPTFMSGGSYCPFRAWWYGRYEFKSGFLFQASHFADVSGRWGVCFTTWNRGGTTDPRVTVPVTLKDTQDFRVVSVGTKAIYNADGREASKWVREPVKGLKGVDAPQMSSGLKVKEVGRGGSLPSNAVGYFGNDSNNLRDSQTRVYMMSTSDTHNHGCPILPGESFRRSTAIFSARLLVGESWENWNDEYLAPDTTVPGYDQWVNDCHIDALIYSRRNNCTAMRDVTYRGRTWRIKNHWFWRTREATLKALDDPKTPALYRDCRAEPVKVPEESAIFGTPIPVNPWEATGDAYLAHLLSTGQLPLSPDAANVLALLDALWVKSLPVRENYAAGRPELHLTAWDSGCYQGKHLWRDLFPTEWAELQSAFKALAERLKPGVYTYGFLRA